VAVFGISLEGKSPQYGLALGAILGLTLAGVGYWKLGLPKEQEIARAKDELQVLENKLAEGRTAKQSLPQFQEEVHRLELELEKLLRILPARRNTPELLRRVHTLADQGNFDLNQFKPAKEVPQEFYSEWPISISFDGNFHNLALFFDRISRFPRILNIDNLVITANRGQDDARTIKAQFVAKTFVFQESEEEEEAATDGKPSAVGAANEIGRAVGDAQRRKSGPGGAP
jgi:type IV pilus assembly protein PilO